ncbi:hypothetical protein FRC05_002549 [Tulasnella sp. 425]|nr:hypothetical protein FRC05_002549 [Tulasnella sp. 425]
MADDDVLLSKSQATVEPGFSHSHKSALPTLPLEVWMMIVDFCRVHNDDRYQFGQVDPLHKPTLHSLCLTCRTLRSIAEPLLLESLELSCRRDTTAEDLKKGKQLLDYLDAHPEKHSRIEYLALDNWPDYLTTIPGGTSLPQRVGTLTNLRGVFMSSVTLDPEMYAELFKLRRIEFVELRDINLSREFITPDLNPDSLGFRSLKIAMKAWYPRFNLHASALGYLARCPSLENLEYTTDRFRILNVGARPQASHTFHRLSSFRTNEPQIMAEWEQLVGFLRDTPNLRSIRLDPHSAEIARKEIEPLPADVLPKLCEFSGNITSAASFVGGRPVSKIVLLPSGDITAITRSSLISLTATSIPLRVLCIYEVHLLPDSLRQVAPLFPCLEELEWHITDPECTRLRPVPVGDLKSLRLLQKVRFTTVERQPGFLHGEEIGLDNIEAEMVGVMQKNHSRLEIMELSKGRVWVRSKDGRPARDIDTFLEGYPDLPSAGEEDRSWDRNLRFYLGEERCEPDDMLIDEIHEEWVTDYDTLEYNHGYIQWLFPIREHGMNFEAQPLQLHEIRAMKSNQDVMRRILHSYKMMLGFYGMRLMDEKTGLLRRSSEYKSRYKNLMYAPHNNLRITRIFKCLSELGLEYLSAGLILHVLNEQTEYGHLRTRTLMDSMDRYWVNCIRNEHERGWLNGLVERVRSRQLDFDREDYERVIEIRKTKGRFAWHADSGEPGQTEGADEEEEEEEEAEVEEMTVELPPGPSDARKRSRDRDCPPGTGETAAGDRARKRLVKNFTSATGHDDDFTFNNMNDDWSDDPWAGVEDKEEDDSDDDNVLQAPGKHEDSEASRRLDESLHVLEEKHQAPVTDLLESNLGEKEDAEDLPDFPTMEEDDEHPPETDTEVHQAPVTGLLESDLVKEDAEDLPDPAMEEDSEHPSDTNAETRQAPVAGLLKFNIGEKEDAEDLPDFPTTAEDSEHLVKTNVGPDAVKELESTSPKAAGPPELTKGDSEPDKDANNVDHSTVTLKSSAEQTDLDATKGAEQKKPSEPGAAATA